MSVRRTVGSHPDRYPSMSSSRTALSRLPRPDFTASAPSPRRCPKKSLAPLQAPPQPAALAEPLAYHLEMLPRLKVKTPGFLNSATATGRAKLRDPSGTDTRRTRPSRGMEAVGQRDTSGREAMGQRDTSGTEAGHQRHGGGRKCPRSNNKTRYNR